MTDTNYSGFKETINLLVLLNVATLFCLNKIKRGKCPYSSAQLHKFVRKITYKYILYSVKIKLNSTYSCVHVSTRTYTRLYISA